MSDFLYGYYAVAPTTWAYLSAFLAVGLFFKFNRFWSVRNLDLIMLILLTPGLLLLHFGYESQRTHPATQERDRVPPSGEGAVSASSNLPDPADRMKCWGYFWLLGVEGFWMIRLLIDPALTRRPQLAPNLSAGGLTFMGIALFMFLMANVIAGGTKLGERLGTTEAGLTRMDRLMEYHGDRGPGYAVLGELPVSANRTMAVISHSAIILGMVLIGAWHFDNITNGIGAAMLYLILPYTTQMTGRLDHFLPAALLVWAVLCYRRPVFSGLFVGAAAGCVYYPLFLLPLWLSYYRQRGWARFLFGVCLALGLMIVGLIFTPSTPGMWGDLKRMFGLLAPAMSELEGIWNDQTGGWDPIYRIPVLATFAALACSMALWPAHKSLATLISCSAAIMLGTQFWHGWGGGLYVAWFLPLTLLVVFRPNLEDRVATTVVRPAWPGRRAPAVT